MQPVHRAGGSASARSSERYGMIPIPLHQPCSPPSQAPYGAIPDSGSGTASGIIEWSPSAVKPATPRLPSHLVANLVDEPSVQNTRCVVRSAPIRGQHFAKRSPQHVIHEGRDFRPLLGWNILLQPLGQLEVVAHGRQPVSHT